MDSSPSRHRIGTVHYRTLPPNANEPQAEIHCPASGVTFARSQGALEHCRGRLAHYKCPTSVEFRDELSRTATGKLQKFKLREPYWAGRDRQVS